MPARSNAFQKLVAYVATQLRGDARVSESALVRDVDGVQREIDTLVELSGPMGTTLSMAIESRDRSRRSDIQWIEELIGKRSSLPMIGSFVAVSRKGFTNAVAEKARRGGIQLLSMREASEFDWVGKFRDLRPLHVSQHWKLASIRFETDPQLALVKGSHRLVHDDNLELNTTVAKFVTEQWEALVPQIPAALNRYLLQAHKTVAALDRPFRWHLSTELMGWTLVDGPQRYAVQRLTWTLHVTNTRRVLPFSRQLLGGDTLGDLALVVETDVESLEGPVTLLVAQAGGSDGAALFAEVKRKKRHAHG